MDAGIERWRKYLRRDPTRFLLDADANPSVYLWYLIDVAHRPESSLAVREARDRVLYSPGVQEILSAQRPEGYWDPPEALAEPRYRATMWNLALLAEYGVPRDSRRARAACEFALQTWLDGQGYWAGLDSIETGYLIHALGYFNLGSDRRVLHSTRALIRAAAREDASIEARLLALWAMENIQLERHDLRDDVSGSLYYDRVINEVTIALAGRREFGPITFPEFDPTDPLFILRVVTNHALVGDYQINHLVDHILQRQNESAQWPLEKSLNGLLLTTVEPESSASRWATLNAVRSIVRLVQPHAKER